MGEKKGRGRKKKKKEAPCKPLRPPPGFLAQGAGINKGARSFLKVEGPGFPLRTPAYASICIRFAVAGPTAQ